MPDPEMVEKELWVYLLAHNLIRLLMAQAAHEAGLHPRELSFKHTLQIWTQWLSVRCGRGQDWQRETLVKTSKHEIPIPVATTGGF